MTDRFDYFVVLAEMRTGSNFLESNLNLFDAVTCFGEAFNPAFIGYPNSTEILGVTQAQREAEPLALLEQIRAADGLGGFRYFHDHDPRVLTALLDDPRCAKIVLTRNPLDSYVSLKIARETGQWRLTNVKRRKETRVKFDAGEFSDYVSKMQSVQVDLLQALQNRGQTAFYLAYEDLQNLNAINGLAAWLGLSQQLDGLDDTLKRQNPSPVRSKVENPDDMDAALSQLDFFNLSRTPSFEPRRGPAVRGHVAACDSPLLFLPIPGAPDLELRHWMAKLDGAADTDLLTDMSQKQLRIWMRSRPGFRSFTVLRHPLARVYSVFDTYIANPEASVLGPLREKLRRLYGLRLPTSSTVAQWNTEDQRSAFDGFLDFLKLNLAGQTSTRVDAHWASQSEILLGFSTFRAPDLILREAELAEDLPYLAQKIGHKEAAPPLQTSHRAQAIGLSDIYDEALEEKARALYQRDYLRFGFENWG